MENPYRTRAKFQGSLPSSSPVEKRLVNSVETDENGNLHQISKIELVDPNDELKDLKYTDFSLANLALSGSFSNLKKVAPISRGKLADADNLSSQLGSISSALDALDSQQMNPFEPSKPSDSAKPSVIVESSKAE